MKLGKLATELEGARTAALAQGVESKREMLWALRQYYSTEST